MIKKTVSLLLSSSLLVTSVHAESLDWHLVNELLRSLVKTSDKNSIDINSLTERIEKLEKNQKEIVKSQKKMQKRRDLVFNTILNDNDFINVETPKLMMIAYNVTSFAKPSFKAIPLNEYKKGDSVTVIAKNKKTHWVKLLNGYLPSYNMVEHKESFKVVQPKKIAVNIRKSMEISNNISRVLQSYETLIVEDSNNSKWYKVVDKDEYAYKNVLEEVFFKAISVKRAVVRNRPSIKKGRITKILNKGSKIRVVQYNENWWKIAKEPLYISNLVVEQAREE